MRPPIFNRQGWPAYCGKLSLSGDCWQSLGEKRQVLGITFSWSPSSVKSSIDKSWHILQMTIISPPSSSFLLLFCLFSLPLVTVMTSGLSSCFHSDTGQLIDCFTISYLLGHVLHQANLSVKLPFIVDKHTNNTSISPFQYTQMYVSVNMRYFCFYQNSSAN